MPGASSNDDYDDPFESWMTPKSEAELFKRDAVAEERQARVDAKLKKAIEKERAILEGFLSAEKTWNAIQAGMPHYRYVKRNSE